MLRIAFIILAIALGFGSWIGLNKSLDTTICFLLGIGVAVGFFMLFDELTDKEVQNED